MKTELHLILKMGNVKTLVCTSKNPGSDEVFKLINLVHPHPDWIQSDQWIRIRNLDPDPGGLKK